MVFPSTQVEFRAARLPWLSASLVCASLWVLLAIPAPQFVPKPDAKAALETAFRYWQTHGYLTPDERIIEAADSHFELRTQSLAIAVIRELGRRGMPDDLGHRKAEQQTLDELVLAAQPVTTPTNPLAETHPLRVYGFIPASPSNLAAVTHLFFYAGWIHFLAIVPLWFILGASAEDRWGAPGLALFTLLATAAATATHALLEPDSVMSLIGAAGPTAALLAVFFLWHRRQPIRVVALVPTFGTDLGGRGPGLRLVPFAIPAAAIPTCWVVANLGLAIWLHEIGVRSDLSITAVLGGLGFGLLVGGALRGFGFESAYLGPDLESKIYAFVQSPAVEEALVARDMGDVDRALELLSDEARRTPDQPEITRLLWDVAISTGQAEGAAATVSLQVQRLIRHGEFEVAVDLWCALVERLPNHRLPANDLVRIVPSLLESQRLEFAVAALRQIVDTPPGELSIGLALQVLDLAEELDPFTALLAARRALEVPELHESKRTRILALIAELDPVDGAVLEFDDDFESEDKQDDSVESGPILEVERSLSLSRNDGPPLSEVAASTVVLEPWIPADGVVHGVARGAVQVVVRKPSVPGLHLSSLPRFEGIVAVVAVPTRLTDKVLYFRLRNGRKAKVAYAQIQAMAVAALRDVSSKPVVVIDLLLNWTEMSSAPLRSIRLRSDAFDPARLITPVGTPTQNLRAFLAELQDRSGALSLPDAGAVRGQPFRVFKFLRAYQRRILKVDC